MSGSPASPGIGTGPVKILKSPKEIDKIQKGDVLVAPMTSPDYVPAMKKSAAIITDEGGQTSHAAIVSRELGIPCVVGTKDATKKLKTDKLLQLTVKKVRYIWVPISNPNNPKLKINEKPKFTKLRLQQKFM